MEPTIEGDPDQGDRVLVDKLWDNLFHPLRFQLIVFHHDKKTVVKRVVGLPKEWFKIEDFDLWAGKEASSLKRIKKSPSQDWDMLSTYWDSRKSPSGFRGSRWSLSPSTQTLPGKVFLDGVATEEENLFAEARRINLKESPKTISKWNMRFRGTITTGYIDGFGRLKETNSGKGSAARDFGVQCNIKFQPGAKLWILYRYIDTPFIFILGNGHIRVWKDAKLLTQSPFLPALLTKKVLDLTLIYLDGRFCLSLNKKDVWEFTPPQLRPNRLALGLFPGNSLMLAASGGKLTFYRLRVIHDFHYLELGQYGSWNPVRLQNKQYFVLGDNSQDSQDSRHFGPIQEGNIIGRPLLVAAPWSRFHFFPR
jgi:hypothetical protein